MIELTIHKYYCRFYLQNQILPTTLTASDSPFKLYFIYTLKQNVQYWLANTSELLINTANKMVVI